MTFEELDELTKNYDSLIHATNQDGEDVIIQWNKDRTIFTTTTAQSNGWLRINRYHKDGSYEEEYKK